MMMICFFIGYSAFADVKQGSLKGDKPSTEIIIEVSGSQSGVWLTGNEYHVIDDVSVPNGDTLIIEPGVTIKFLDYFSFNISGTLFATGTETDSIYFTSGQDTCNLGDWNEIKFEDCSNDNSIISFTTVEYANIGILCSFSSPSIRNNNIKDSNHTGIQCFDSSSPIINNIINNNFYHGIWCCQSSSPFISKNTIINNLIGIWCFDISSIEISHNIFRNNNHGISCWFSVPNIINYSPSFFCDDSIYSGISYSSSCPMMNNNIISDNKFGIYCYSSSPTICNNTIKDNEDGIYCHISFSFISNNTINNNFNGIRCQSSFLTIEKNIINNNISNGIICFISSPRINDNNINNNLCAINCRVHSSSRIKNNIIRNNNYGVFFEGNNNSLIINNTFVNNIYGIFSLCYSSPDILNNIFINNYYGIIANSVLSSLEYNIFWENNFSVSGDNLPCEFGELVMVNINRDSCDIYYNLFLDPLFKNIAYFDFHLTEYSPCIDAGNPNPIYYDPDGTIADMGAFYYDQGGVGINRIAVSNVNIYPNPSNGIFNISIEGISEKVQGRVFDVNGNDHRFFEINKTGNLSTKQLDLKELTAGVYFISFSGKDFNQVKKIVIQ